MMKKNALLVCLAVLLLVTLPGCDALTNTNDPQALTASGMVSANEVSIAAEVGGRVVEALVEEGDEVKAGDVLFRVDDQLLRAQEQQAKDAVQTAEAALNAAKAQAENARIQAELATQGARLQDQQARSAAWYASQPEEINLPVWYFQKSEQISAAEAEVQDAQANLDAQNANLEKALSDNSNQTFVDVEKRLADSQAAFAVASQILDQANLAVDGETLVQAASDARDQALKELEAAQLEYRRMVTTAAADEILEARAKVAVAQSRLDAARDRLTSLQTGDHSMQIEAAQAGVNQAEAGVAQAEAGLAQAKSALAIISLQIEKTSVKAPVDGVVLTKDLQVGEIVAPGGLVMSIGQLDDVELTVYVAEADYGEIKLDQTVSVRVDSFPGQGFKGKVCAIANEAEFTPRNVQTADGRKTTVYAVKIAVSNPDRALKPGMPADVTFED